MTVEQALEKVRTFEEEKRRLQEKKAEIEVKRAEIQEKIKEVEDELGKLLVKQALGEFKDEKKISSLEVQAEKLRRELRAVGLAVQELQRRLSEMEKAQDRIFLEFFSVRRDQVLDFVKKKIREHREVALKLGALEKALGQSLAWLYRWETGLAEDLEKAGLDGKKAFKTFGTLLHSQKLDSTIRLVDPTNWEVKSFEELWQSPNVPIPVLWEEEGLSFVESIPNCLNFGDPQSLRKCAWRFIRDGLGLVSDENQRKEEK